jgi:uncharacterized protein YbjQ (UPF0145 family)
MKGLLSLDQELRAVRRASKQKHVTEPDRPPVSRQTERPWQSDIDSVQQTMREVLRAIAGLSGVELPGLPPGLEDDAAPAPRLDIKTLKDRFRNDLEGFSIRTTEELAKRAKEQTHAALDAVQDEVRGSIDQVAAEFREKLQLPAQIEKVVEPSVKEVVGRLEKSLSQKVERLLAEHEQLVQDRLQGVVNSVQTQIGTFEQTVQQIRDMKADLVAQSSAHQAKALAEVEALLAKHDQLVQDTIQGLESSVHARIGTLEQTVQQVRELKADSVEQSSVQQAKAAADVEALLAKHERLVQDRLEGMESSVQTRIGTLEQTVQQVRERKADSAAQLSVEQTSAAELAGRIDQIAAEFRQKLPDPVQIEKLLKPSVEGASARLETSLSQKVEHLMAEHQQLVHDRLQGMLSSVQAQISALEQSVQQIRELKANAVVQLPAEQLTSESDHPAKEPETSPTSGLNGFLDQAFSRIESSFNSLAETARAQPAQSAYAGLGDRANPLSFSEMDRERRVQQALDALGRLGTKDSHPAS